jgi:hypothetical protein
VIALGRPAQVLKTLQIEGPVLIVDEDLAQVELPKNVDHPWRGEGETVATRLASGAHGGRQNRRSAAACQDAGHDERSGKIEMEEPMKYGNCSPRW